MLWTFAVLLVIMWLLGMITSYTCSGFMHVLLLVARVVVLLRVCHGRAMADARKRLYQRLRLR